MTVSLDGPPVVLAELDGAHVRGDEGGRELDTGRGVLQQCPSSGNLFRYRHLNHGNKFIMIMIMMIITLMRLAGSFGL